MGIPEPVPDLARLISLLQEHSLRRGDFVLSSGQKTHYYIDARRTTMLAEGLQVIGNLGVKMIAELGWAANAIGGLTLGADPVAYAVALASRSTRLTLNAFSVRKQRKGHGTGQRIEGCFSDGAQVIVAEDVITTGGSTLEAIGAIEGDGGRVAGVLCVVDRMEGGRKAIEEAGYPVETMVSIRELGVEPKSP